jgi:hypothetical protein
MPSPRWSVSPKAPLLEVSLLLNELQWAARADQFGYFLGGANSIGRTYDVSPDGRRFLMIKPDPASSATIAVVQHWFEELSRLTRK